MNPTEYRDFARRLQAELETDPRVVGLVFAGSAAHQSHEPDEWSDHDFFVVTVEGAQEGMRQELDWLPDSTQIVLSVRETEHGLKVLYASGHMLEFAVFDRAEISRARLNDYAIAFDRGGVTEAAARIASSEPRAVQTHEELLRNIGMVLCLLQVGAGRVARGEAISGQVFIRTYALMHLLPVLAQVLPAEQPSSLDNLDALRRFEQAFPKAGADINAALNHPPISAAVGLLDVVERYLGGLDGFPTAAAQTVRALLARAGQSTI